MAVDIIARALAAGLMGADGNVSPDKLPKINTDEATKYSVGGIGAGVNLKGHNIIDVMMKYLCDVMKTRACEWHVSERCCVSGFRGLVGSSFSTSTFFYSLHI